ncbi:hypothetical protein TELCIR_12821 [Teladorsagia circumcincta]|uniref:C-type lectin domain-containing protein n=1 Tax=Teladorsagia circumcincta TaxID=45464 RepID=A0A2G9U5R2_TELCI|nr:hypothetical protein TELCIR_12821 [Teladorsagia circumcincta]
MLFFCVSRLFVGLIGVVLTLGADIDDATIEKAKNGEWIPLPNDSEEMVKFVNTSVLGTKSFTHEQLENFCEKEDSQLASFHSKEEDEFILGLYFALLIV